MNLIAVDKDGNQIKGVNVVYLDHNGKPEQAVAYSKRHIFPQDGSMRLSTTFPDKNGRVICVGDEVRYNDDIWIVLYCPWHNYKNHYFITNGDRWEDLTPELAKKLEVVE